MAKDHTPLNAKLFPSQVFGPTDSGSHHKVAIGPIDDAAKEGDTIPASAAFKTTDGVVPAICISPEAKAAIV
jgi:hypothetical protein